MVATSGDVLLPQGAVDAVRRLMVPGAALVTPNAPETEVLTGKAVDGLNGQRRAAEKLLEMGALAALVKAACTRVRHDVDARPDRARRGARGPAQLPDGR